MARTTINLTDNISQLRSKINDISFDIGDISLLSTPGADSDLVQSVNDVSTSIGDTSNLTTTATTLVTGINELDAELGTITSVAMGTTASTVSGAIAELEAEIDTLNTFAEPTQALTTTAITLADAVNELDAELSTQAGKLGTITAAAMGTTATTVSGAIAELDSDRDRINTLVEPTRALSQFTATTVMGALNELKTTTLQLDSDAATPLVQIGDLTGLTTTDKSNLVDALNEVKSSVDSDGLVRDRFSATDAGGDGSFSYSAATGVFTYTGPSATETRAHFSAGEGIDIASGVIAGEDATTTNKGIASFNTANFTVTSGAVSLKSDGIVLGTNTTGNYVDSATGGTGITVTHTPGEGSSIGVAITSGGVAATQLASSAVTAVKIASNAVTTVKIAADAVDGTKIADDAIANEHVADDAISQTELKDVVTLVIYNSSGTALKTLYGAGS